MKKDEKVQVKPYPKNAKRHPAKQLEQLAKIVQMIGWRQPVEVNQDGVIVVGHARFLVWQEYGDRYNLPEVWVVDGIGKTIMGKHDERKLTPEQETMWRLADNKLNESEWDMELALEDLKILDDDLKKLTGFDEDIVDPFVEEFEKYNNDNCEYPIVPKLSEKYSYVLIVAENEIDASYLETVLDIKPYMSYKGQKTGKSSVITVEHLKKVWETK